MCHHNPQCPDARSNDRLAARVRTAHPEQGWSLLCNGVVAFDDSGALLPDGRTVSPESSTCQPRGASRDEAGWLRESRPGAFNVAFAELVRGLLGDGNQRRFGRPPAQPEPRIPVPAQRGLP
jgi:hypothetical protein